MKKTIHLSLSVLAFGLFFLSMSSCSKKKGCTNSVALNFDGTAEEDDGSCQLAGTGGATTIVAFPKHHGGDVWNSTAYVKFNTKEFPGIPGSVAYDLTVSSEPTHNHVELENLKVGNYYIYMTGYDSSITATVKGGMPYTLAQSTGEVDINVAITE